jgi:hypothetical protein
VFSAGGRKYYEPKSCGMFWAVGVLWVQKQSSGWCVCATDEYHIKVVRDFNRKSDFDPKTAVALECVSSCWWFLKTGSKSSSNPST